LITKARILHIDGLRGVAIGLVVVYHLFPDYLKGGFAGVDIFFVISGYVIHRQLVTLKRFSFREFYIKRAIRIFPSLLVVVLLVTLLGRYFFLDYPYRLLLNSVATSSLFATNYYFIGSSNYFDIDSVSKPLLPLWSLAVEEQFYLLWPFVFWAFIKSYRRLLPVLIIASFLSSLYFGSNSPNINFYSLQTRFWEIAIGILISTLKYEKETNSLRFLRYLLIASSIPIVLFGVGENRWPNFATLMIVLTTSVLIIFPGNIVKRLLSSKILVFLGRISFPLYLIHWPLISFYSNLKPAHIPLLDKFVLLFLSVSIAFALFGFLESPIQKLRGTSRSVTALSTSLLLLFTGAFALHLKSDLPVSSQEIRQSVTSGSSIVNRNSWYFSGKSDLPQVQVDFACGEEYFEDLILACQVGTDWSEINALVVGDSKAEIVFRALLRNSGGATWGFIGGGSNPVIPLANNASGNNSKISQSSVIPEWISKQDSVKRVVVVSATRNIFSLGSDFSLDEMGSVRNTELISEKFISWLKPMDDVGKSISIVRDNPTMRDPTYCHGVYSAFKVLDRFVQVSEKTDECFIMLQEFLEITSSYQQLIKAAEAQLQSVTLVDSTDYFCNKSENRCDQFRNNRLLYSYSDHISDFAADYVAKNLLLASKPSIL
jgi:peptidoglycan/LPS O-acetylase OafA/YrhL